MAWVLMVNSSVLFHGAREHRSPRCTGHSTARCWTNQVTEEACCCSVCFTGLLGGLGSSQSWGDSCRRIRTVNLLSGIFEEHFFALPGPILCTCPPSPVLSLWCFVMVLWVTPLVFPKTFSHLRHMMFFFLVAYRDQICLPSIICLLLVGNA